MVCDVIQTGYEEKGVSVDSLWKVTVLRTLRQPRFVYTPRIMRIHVHRVQRTQVHRASEYGDAPTAQAAGASKVGVVWTLDSSDAHENQHKQVTLMSCRCRYGRSHCP